ncbi:MAG: hypothetical protein Q7S45_00055 [Candidatus Curtissbacteria bacterium]|nr:hypothetical protein [Candidatus Curtissbacteria bacterium]
MIKKTATVFFIGIFFLTTVLVVTPADANAFSFGDVARVFTGEPKPAVNPSPKPSPKPSLKPSPKPAKAPAAKVKGVNDSKQESAIGKFFKSIGNGIAAVGDFLWPFESKPSNQKDTKVAQKTATASPAATPSPSPAPASEPGITVETAAESPAPVVVTANGDFTNLVVSGKATLGSDSSDRIYFKGLMGSDILVDTTKAYNLGSGGGRFKSGYFSNNVYVGEETRINADGLTTKNSGYWTTTGGGSIYLNPDSNNVYIGNSSNLEIANNLTVKGAISATSGAITADAIDITPSTNIDALDITGTNINTADLIDLDATATTTGDAIDINMANTRTSGSAILITDASVAATVTGDLIQINVTGTPDTNTIDIDYTAGFSGNAIDITTATAASTGNLIDLNFGAIADTGDAVNVSIDALAVGAQALVVTNAASIRTASMIQVDDNNSSGLVATFDLNIASTRGGLFDIDTSGIWTNENLIDITTGAQAWTANILDVNVGAAASTGDVFNVSMGSSNLAGGAFVVADAGGVRSDAIIDITSASTATTDAGSIMQINGTGALAGANVLDINVSGGSTSGNVIDITTSGILTASNLIDLNFGAIADTGDAVNVSIDALAVGAQALVVTNAASIRTASMIQVDDNNSSGLVATFDLNIASTRGGLMDIDTSGAFITENLIDITTGAQIWTANILDINVGAAAATGDVINIDLGASAPAAQALVVSGTSSTATAGVIDLNIDTAAAQSATVVDITSTVGIMDGSDTFKGMNVAITGANHTGASNVIRGVDVSLTTADADATETGINVGDNWDLGISSTSGIGIGAQKTLTADSTTPSVLGTSHAITANANATLISNFTGGRAGQLLVVEVNDAFTTYDCIGSEATINCGGIDIVAAAGDLLTWVYDGTIWNLVNWLNEGTAQTGVDLAEYFGSTETLVPGDVVSADLANPEYVVKTAKAYDSRLLGVVSTLPGLVIGNPNDLNQIALVGRVPVKVTDENGAIKAGDYLTSSATRAGYAMKATKAGPVVGMALADFAGADGKVVTFIKPTWFDPITEQKRAVLAALGLGSGSVLGTTTTSSTTGTTTTTTATSPLVGPAADGSLGVLEEAADLMVHGLLTAKNLKVTTAAEFAGTLVVRGLATFEGDLVVKGALATGSLDLSGALTRTMTAGSAISAGDPVVVTGANTVARAGGSSASVVGLAATSASAGASVKVAVAGTVGGYSGLATGSRYYLGAGGVVTTAPGGDRAVHIGIAISGSEMIVQIFESVAPPAPKVVDTATVDGSTSASGTTTTTTTESATTTTTTTDSTTGSSTLTGETTLESTSSATTESSSTPTTP